MSAAAVTPAAGTATLPQGDAVSGLRGVLARIAATAGESRWTGFVIFAIALLFPFIDQALGLNLMNPALRILTSVMLALGLNIVVGFAGLLDLGYVAFWAIGAYVVGWLASGMFTGTTIHLLSGVNHQLPGIHISIWLLFPVAAIVTAVAGVLLGAPTLRLRGDYLAIVTLGFGEIIPKLFQNGDDLFGHNLTNGTRGIAGLDTPSLGGTAGDTMLGMGWGTWGPLNLMPWYFLGLALVMLCWYVSRQMQWSKLGRAWMAIREDETAAAAMGINLVNTKLWAYGIGAALGGFAGVYHGARIGSIFPASFMFYISISVLCMVIIGGMGNVWGAILGACTIEGLNFWLLPSLTNWSASMGLNIDFSSYNMMIFGGLLVVMMLYRPQGFLPSKARTIDLAAHEVEVEEWAAVPAAATAEPVADAHGHLVDYPHAGHVDHYPAALHGPEGDHTHPVLDAGAIGHVPPPPVWHSAPKFPRFEDEPHQQQEEAQ